jgi:hypothetical protein
MTCNAAVAITKAAVTDERLRALLDEHLSEVIEIFRTYLHKQYADREVSVELLEDQARVLMQVGRVAVALQGGEITTRIRGNGPNEVTLAEMLNERASTLLKLIADQLFTNDIERILQSSARLTGKRAEEVEMEGVKQRATIFSAIYRNLKLRVFVLSGGQVQVFIDSGTFAQAKEATLLLMQQMNSAGAELQFKSQVEQHRFGSAHAHITQTQKGVH